MKTKDIKISIIGLGYVGLPLAIEFGKKYNTTGFDINKERINELNNGIDKTLEVKNIDFENSSFSFTNEKKDIEDSNVYIVTVPTPVDSLNNPDLEPLVSATKTVSSVLKKNDLVIYESTVFPGATEQFCVPILEEFSDLKYNTDFFCGYSPERINPGDKKHGLRDIIKVTSGSTNETASFVDNLYKTIIKAGTHKAESIAVAEAGKVIENIQRDVNIALMNEFAMIFNKLNLDTTEVLNAAGTKWNFLPFKPGLVGGHCIGVDPYYLTYKAKEVGYDPKMILAGRHINEVMGKFIADNTILELSKIRENFKKPKIAILGLTFKENCPDLRNTKVVNIIKHLENLNADIIVTDEYANVDEAKNIYNIDLVSLDKIKNVDAVILAVAHDFYKSISKESWKDIFNDEGVFIDVKSIFQKDYFNNLLIHHWRL